jgi:hypothetical protein
MRKAKTPTVTNVHLNFSSPTRFAFCFDHDGARYHRWYFIPKGATPDTMEPSDNTLYVNPPLGIEYRREGWFDTKKLKCDGPTARPLLVAAWSIALQENVIEKAIADLEAKAQAEIEARRQAMILVRKQAVAAELYDALRGFRDEYGDRDTWPEDMVSLLDNADAVLKLADEGPDGAR